MVERMVSGFSEVEGTRMYIKDSRRKIFRYVKTNLLSVRYQGGVVGVQSLRERGWRNDPPYIGRIRFCFDVLNNFRS